ANFLKYNIPEGSSILEIGSGSGTLLNTLKPKRGVGIDISSEMVRIAKKKFKQLDFFVMDGQSISLNEKFDFVIISDTIGYFDDVELVLKKIRQVCHPRTRVIITYQNFLWLPLLDLAESLRLKMPSRRLNWLNLADIENLLALENYDTVKTGRRLLLPRYLPIISWFVNKYLARLPLINHLCLTNFIIARPVFADQPDNKAFSVSVIIPARNERGNIENAVKRVPKMGKETEIIFVEGNSTDGTLDEIKRICKIYPNKNIQYLTQDGKGKGDAVRKGFAVAKGDILMILDADLTVPPEDLPKFYNAIATGKGEFINGSRLVYPMEKEAMRFLNIIGNRFFSIAFTWLLGQRIKDTLCGTKVIFKKDYDQLVANRHYFGDFDPFGDFDLLFGSSKMNLKLAEVPIRYDARQYGSTNISRFKHGWLLLKMVAFALNKIKFY
ncbi:MAG: glycosyltransferase, partial [Patescibacteria group bacterium]